MRTPARRRAAQARGHRRHVERDRRGWVPPASRHRPPPPKPGGRPTAPGQTVGNRLVSPTLNDLLGGIQSVTLSDEEARRRGTQKSVLERKAPPTFDVLVAIQDRDRVAIHM